MGVRLVMVGCTATYRSPFFRCKGDERAIRVLGWNDDVIMELVCDAGDAVHNHPLRGGDNPFPIAPPFARYAVSKHAGPFSVPTTVQIITE